MRYYVMEIFELRTMPDGKSRAQRMLLCSFAPQSVTEAQQPSIVKSSISAVPEVGIR